MRSALLAIALMAALPAWAQWSVSVYGLSKHSESGYCEINPGLSINYEIAKDLRVGFGRFLNSQCQWSNGAGPVYTPLHVGPWSLGVAFLRVTGYKDKPVWVPLPAGSYALDKRKSIDFFAAHKGDESVAGAALRFAF